MCTGLLDRQRVQLLEGRSRPGVTLFFQMAATQTLAVTLRTLALVTPTTRDWTGERFSRVRSISK
jgi:hypothetical protein